MIPICAAPTTNGMWHDASSTSRRTRARSSRTTGTRDYFQGRDAIGREVATSHMIKVKPPQILMGSSKPPSP